MALKVFRAAMGFFDTVVAAPSQKAALSAWGSHQDLFKDKTAEVTTDEAAVAAALAKPGVVLRRGVGTTDPFRPATDPVQSLPQVPTAKPRLAKTAPRPKPALDRSKLIAAEAALSDRESRWEAELADLAQQRRALEAHETDLLTRAEQDRARLRASVERVRAAYVEAGGEP